MKQRPTSVTVFGILNIVFGVIGLCGMGITVFMFLSPPNPGMPNPVLDMMKGDGVYSVFMKVSLVLGSIATFVLIAAGVGLLTMKSWGRSLSIGYGIYAILSGIVGTIINYFFLLKPLLDQAQAMQAGPERAGAIGGAIGGGIGGCIGLIYPLLLLFFMCSSKVKRAFSGEPESIPSDSTDSQSSFAPPADPDNPFGSPHSK